MKHFETRYECRKSINTVRLDPDMLSSFVRLLKLKISLRKKYMYS